MTRADHATGTDRVAEVAARLEAARIIVNLQGDEPEVSGDALDRVVALLDDDPEAPMATLATPIRDESIYRDPSCVKVVCSARGRALYFSRSPIPYHRDGLPDPASVAAADRLSPPGPLRLSPRLPAVDSAHSPLRRSRPPRSSSSSASSRPAIRSPSASSTSRASASTRPRITGGSSSAGGRTQDARLRTLELGRSRPRPLEFAACRRCQMMDCRGWTRLRSDRSASSSTKRGEMPPELDDTDTELSRSRWRRSRSGSSRPTTSAARSITSAIRPLPSYREVVDILADLREILYPGYGRRQNLHLGNVAYHVGDLIDSLHDRLTQQIARAFRHDCKAARPRDRLRAKAERDRAFGSSRRSPSCGRRLAEDVQAAYDGDPAAKGLDEIVFCYPGVAAVTVYRMAHELLPPGRAR